MTKNLVGYGHGRLGVNFAKAGEKHRIELHTTESRWSGPRAPGPVHSGCQEPENRPGLEAAAAGSDQAQNYAFSLAAILSCQELA